MEVAAATALDARYRLIDTTLTYQNEQEIENVLNKYIAEEKFNARNYLSQRKQI